MKRVASAQKSRTVEIETENEIVDNEVEELQKVPPKQLKNYNLKNIKSFKQIRRRYKLKNQSMLFVNDLKVVLDEYKPEDHQLDNDLLVHILNIAEMFFIYGNKKEREEQKSESIKKLMTAYYRDDEELLNVMITTVWNKVKKSNMFKRTWQRFKNKFFLK